MVKVNKFRKGGVKSIRVSFPQKIILFFLATFRQMAKFKKNLKESCSILGHLLEPIVKIWSVFLKNISLRSDDCGAFFFSQKNPLYELVTQDFLFSPSEEKSSKF